MKEPLYILFGALFTVVVAWALGAILFRRLRLKLYRAEERLLAFVTGSALLSGIVFLLCCTGLARKGVLLAIGFAAIAGAWRMGVHRTAGDPLPPLSKTWRWLTFAVFGLFGFLYFCNAMAPEMSPDGAAYHLVWPEFYYRAHGFVRIPWNLYANLTQGIELLFLFAYSFGRLSAAALVHFSFLATLPLLMIAYSKRVGIPRAGTAGALFFFVSPVVGMDGSIAYVDVALAAVLFALFYLLQIWEEQREPALVIPIGILAGFSVEIKYTAVLAVPYAIGFVGWKLWRSHRPLLRPVAVVAGLALACIVPWLVKNWIWMADPVTPFANALFPNPYIHLSFEQEYTQFQRIYTLTSYKQIPWELTVSGYRLCGLFGPLFLLTPLALLALRKPLGRQLLLAGAIFATPYLSNIGTRFLIPSAPFLSLALAMALNWEWLLLALVVAHAVASWPDVMKLYTSEYAWRLVKAPYREALRIIPEDDFLRRNFPGYSTDREIERLVPPDGKVFSFSQPAESYTSREILVKYLAAPNEVLGDILWTPLYPEYQPSDIFDAHFPARVVRKLRVLKTNQFDQMWNVSELRVFDHGGELARSPHWRLRAQPNPWDVQLAFDNSPVTRWRSWQPARPGMYLQIDFGADQEVDGVRVETEPDWREAEMRVEAADSTGHWQPLTATWDRHQEPVKVNLRRAATAELRARGVRYLLIGYDDLGAEDFQQHPDFWGIRMLADAGGSRLYYIE